MAIRLAVHRVCDRCIKPFDEQHIEYGDETPKYDRKQMKVTIEDHVVLKFDDLCPDCEGVVEGLVQRLRMEPDKRRSRKEKDKDAANATETPASPDLPDVPAGESAEPRPTTVEPLF